MNTTSKTILASTLFTALLTGTSAYADRKGDITDYVDHSGITESAEISKVRYEVSTIDTDNSFTSGRKSNLSSDYSASHKSELNNKVRYEIATVYTGNSVHSGKK